MSKRAGGLIELMLAFLILSVVVAFAMQTAIVQLKSTKTDSSQKEVGAGVQIQDIEGVVNRIEAAKKIKQREEQKAIDNWLQ
ncbi:MAG: hypothetical protein E7Z93_02740 [Cyanobacteria bacterium SIG32]|nr:hypothetical protein [Cyanobacteria bacterium SIG32]